MEKYTVFMDWKNHYCQNDYESTFKMRVDLQSKNCYVYKGHSFLKNSKSN